MSADTVRHDAVVLAGGRGRRLGGVEKPLLLLDGDTLLDRALDAARGADRRVVVGPDTLPVPPGVSLVREDPPFGGPAAALGVGLAFLGSPDLPGQLPADWTLVLAADLPSAADLVPALLAAAVGLGADVDAVVAVDTGGRRQWLTAVYRSAALRRVVHGDLDGRPLRALLDGLQVEEVPLDVQDIDTPEDAARWGVSSGTAGGAPSGPAPGR